MKKRGLALMVAAAMVFSNADYGMFFAEAQDTVISEETLSEEESGVAAMAAESQIVGTAEDENPEIEAGQESQEIQEEEATGETWEDVPEDMAGETLENAEETPEDMSEDTTENRTEELPEDTGEDMEASEDASAGDTEAESAEDITEGITEEWDDEEEIIIGDTPYEDEEVEITEAEAAELEGVNASEIQSGDYTYTVYNNEATITKYNGTAKVVTIPEVIDGYVVTAIGSDAFYYCETLTSVKIPESVSSIGASAFSGCHSLTSVEIPGSVSSIGASAFSGCRSLTSVKIPESVSSIGASAFSGCRSLTSVEIPGSISKIEEETFRDCNNLTSVKIPGSVSSIGNGAFSYCSSLTSVEIPVSISSIGASAFMLCNSLTSVKIPESVSSIGVNAFSGCISLTSVEIPVSISKIEAGTFSGCSSLTSVGIPVSVSSIGSGAFRSCSSLTSVEIPVSISKIEAWTFCGCSSLTSVEIPGSVSSIGGSAFENCSSLTSVEIPGSVSSIGGSAFENCNSLTSVEIPVSISKIEGGTFCGCSSLTSVEIPGSVSSIGWSAFENCNSLTSVEIPGSVSSIGSSAFENCNSLTSVEIPGSVSSIGGSAFENCNSLTSVEIPVSISKIEGWTFYGCSSLTSVEIPGSVSSIGWSAFENCNSLTSVEIPGSVSSIGSSAFENCNSLTSVEIPGSVSQVGNFAFGYCTSLKKINIPSSVTSIGDETFSDCPNLVIYGAEGSYAETYAKKHNIPFNVITEGSFLLLGDLEEVNTEKFTLKIDGKDYEVSDTFNMNPMTQILVESEDKRVLCFIRDGEILQADAVAEAVYPAIRVRFDKGGILRKNVELEYVNGGFSWDAIPLQAEIYCEVKENDYYTASDLRNFTELSFDIAEVELELNNVGAGIYFGNKGVFGLSKVSEKEAFTIRAGETKTFQYEICSDSLRVPEEVNTSVRIQGRLKLKGSGNFRESGVWSGLVSIYNTDLEKKLAEQEKASHEAQKQSRQAILDARNILATRTLVALDQNFMGSYFDVKQQKIVRDFLTVWITEIMEAQYEKEGTISGIIGEAVRDKVKGKVFGKLGINTKAMLSGRKTTADVSIVGTTLYGERTIEFHLSVDDYNFGKNPYAAYGTLEYEVTDTTGIPSNVPKKAMGGCTFSDLKVFGECLKEITDAELSTLSGKLWGNDVDAVVETIVGKPLSIFIDWTSGSSFSGNIFTLMQTPTQIYIDQYKRKHSVKCPVDVYIYNCLGELCGAIENNVVDPSYNRIRMGVDGDEKYFYLDGQDYTIKLVGSDRGTMNYTVEEYLGENVIRTIDFQDVPLTNGKTYLSMSPEEIRASQALYALRTEDGEVIKANSDTWEDNLTERIYTEGLTLNKSSVNMNPGSALALQAQVKPSNAADKRITWRSDQPTIASVDANGQVKAMKPGRAVITAETRDGGFTAFCTVTVLPVNISGFQITVGNQSYTGSALTPAVTVRNGSVILVKGRDYTCTYSNNINAGTASVKVTGIGNYTGTKTASFLIIKKAQPHTHSWSGWKTISQATVFAPEKQQRTCASCKQKETQTKGKKLTPKMTVNAASIPLKVKQSTTKLKVTGLAAGDYIKSWRSSNTKVVKVNGSGKITALKKAGKATITITLASGLSKSVKVTVQKSAVKTRKISGLSKKLTLKVGKKTTLKPVITPITSLQKVKYSSSKKKVATVSSKGVVTAKKAGTARITVKSGSKKVTVTVKVVK